MALKNAGSYTWSPTGNQGRNTWSKNNYSYDYKWFNLRLEMMIMDMKKLGMEAILRGPVDK